MKAMNLLKYAGLAVVASSLAFATNITIADPFTDNPGSGTFATPYSNAPAGPIEAGRVEYNASTGNSWDLASFELNRTTGMLTLSGGFNFLTGVGSGDSRVFPMGDIFVYSGVPFANASDSNKDLWTHVIHFERSVSKGNIKLTGTDTIRYQILGAPVAGYHYTQGSGALFTGVPWMVDNASGSWSTLTGNYSTAFGPDVSGLNQPGSFFMNSVTVDISSILADGQYFHTTMRCANDVLWGRVPDGGFTLVLLSLGLGGLALAVRRRK